MEPSETESKPAEEGPPDSNATQAEASEPSSSGDYAPDSSSLEQRSPRSMPTEVKPRVSGLLVDLARIGPRVPFTSISISVCVAIWLILTFGGKSSTTALLLRLLSADMERVRGGEWWVLLTSCFAHFALWHLFFNVYWLWAFGSRLERELGTLRFALFSIVAGVASSAAQLAASDVTGHGYSGIGYALFGLAWMTKSRWTSLTEVLSPRMVSLFWAWFFGCIAMTEFGGARIGNAAHAMGLAIGISAGWFTMGRKRAASLLALAAGLSLVVGLFWRPWSPLWRGEHALSAFEVREYDTAEKHFNAYVSRGGDQLWATRYLARIYMIEERKPSFDSALELLRRNDPEEAAQFAGDRDEYLELRASLARATTGGERYVLSARIASLEWDLYAARILFERALIDYPNSGLLHSEAAAVALRATDVTDAEFQRALELAESAVEITERSDVRSLDVLAQLLARRPSSEGNVTRIHELATEMDELLEEQNVNSPVWKARIAKLRSLR